MKRKIYIIPLFALFVMILLTACAHTHQFEAWVVQKAASCVESGVETRTCSCGQTETRYTPRAEHTVGDWTMVTEPTCTAPGFRQLICTECALVVEVAAAPAADHTPGDWVVVVEPTCMTEGLMHQLCADCEVVLQSSGVPVTDHTAADWITAAEPTCTADGLRHQFCSECHVLLQTSTVPARDHSVGDWIVAVTPTCITEGVQHQICSECKLVLNVTTVPQAGHTEGRWIVDAAPTTTKEGSKHQICAVCSATLKTEVIPAIPTYLVILDAGHGGKDPGAVAGGVNEKDINLQIVLKMKELLEARGIAVLLTRDDDTFLELEERTQFANATNACLFVSIHCNSYSDTSVSGFEVYYYQSAKAKAVANAIVADLEATVPVKMRGVKTKGLYVVKYTDMPAVLLEMGFLTNAQERQKLCTDEYQTTMAQSVVASIVRSLG